MLTNVLLYNGVMIAADLAAIGQLWRRRTPTTAAGGLALGAALAVWIAVALGRSFFPMAYLAAFGIFIHAPLLLAAVGLLMRRAAPRRALAAGLLAAGITMVGVDAFFIEPYWLQVSRHRIATPRVTEPVRIVVVADLQTDDVGPYERRALETAMAEQPDLLLFAGDYIQQHDPEKFAPLCRQLGRVMRHVQPDAPLGAFAVKGNVDDPGWTSIFDDTPVRVMTSPDSVSLGDLWLTCLPVEQSYDTDLTVPRPDGAKNAFHIVLGHVPDYALGSIDAELLIAGHTHGGQVRLPGIGPLVTLCAIPRAWAAGLTTLPSSADRDRRHLLVSRGVGLERRQAPRLRFLCRPEIVVIDLVPTTESDKR